MYSDDDRELVTGLVDFRANTGDKSTIEHISVSEDTIPSRSSSYRLYKRRWLGLAVLVRIG